jgi:hypothetical protein
LTKSIGGDIWSNGTELNIMFYNIGKNQSVPKKTIYFKNPKDYKEDKVEVGNIVNSNNLAYVTLIVTSSNNKVIEKKIVLDIDKEELKEVLY